MRVLVDTNVLLRIAKPDHAEHPLAMQAVAVLHARRDRCVMTPQASYEYYVVATRPVENNGLGLTPQEAVRDLTDLRQLFPLLRDERAVFDHWLTLLTRFGIRGKTAHDARLVAAMRRHAVTHLLTFNRADFLRYTEVVVLDPASVVHGPLQ